MYQTTTRGIAITVQPQFLEDQSAPGEGHFVWAYHVRIENQGAETVQLLSRHWKITDGIGRLHEVQGPGVVGERPVLKPGEAFEYTSGTPLCTPSGFMGGTYQMRTTEGDDFDAVIPVFSLDSPYQSTRLN